MAKQKYGEKGLVIAKKFKDYRDLLEEDYSKIERTSKPLLSAYVDYLSRIANKRLTEFENMSKKTGYDFTTSLAYKGVQNDKKLFLNDEGKRRFGYKDLSLNELRSMYVKLVDFLQLKTSTVEGWAEVKLNVSQKAIEKQLKFKSTAKNTLLKNLDREDSLRILSNDEEKILWEVFNKFYETNLKTAYDSDQAIVDITRLLRNKDFASADHEDILEAFKEITKAYYEKEQEKELQAKEDFDNAESSGVMLQ